MVNNFLYSSLYTIDHEGAKRPKNKHVRFVGPSSGSGFRAIHLLKPYTADVVVVIYPDTVCSTYVAEREELRLVYNAVLFERDALIRADSKLWLRAILSLTEYSKDLKAEIDRLDGLSR